MNTSACVSALIVAVWAGWACAQPPTTVQYIEQAAIWIETGRVKEVGRASEIQPRVSPSNAPRS